MFYSRSFVLDWCTKKSNWVDSAWEKGVGKRAKKIRGNSQRFAEPTEYCPQSQRRVSGSPINSTFNSCSH